MTITTLAQVKSGLRPPIDLAKQSANISVGGGPWETTWAGVGNPAPGSYDTTLNGATLSGDVTGAIYRVNPASGNAHVARLAGVGGTAVVAGNVMLCDRLWHNGGIDVTSTSPQSITSPTWPARDRNGSTNGVGVFLCVEVSATVGAATPTITIGYTNSAGTSGRTATNVVATLSAAPTNSAFWIGLQAGDVGVRSVQSITLSASWISGTINIVAFRPIMRWIARNLIESNVADVLRGCLPRIYDDSVLYLMPHRTGQQGVNLTSVVNYLETHG